MRIQDLLASGCGAVLGCGCEVLLSLLPTPSTQPVPFVPSTYSTATSSILPSLSLSLLLPHALFNRSSTLTLISSSVSFYTLTSPYPEILFHPRDLLTSTSFSTFTTCFLPLHVRASSTLMPTYALSSPSFVEPAAGGNRFIYEV
ncbi:hypothetical protein E2C01_044242 [Portunus trituberculatus]|uniref:Uncharacterized protein n=1 Tax=Portunus trituberculatus TaxID=210409 RepID=A0A5B7G1R8_PORTR|nr:hypothetical protein [Portunus trituberculatus]